MKTRNISILSIFLIAVVLCQPINVYAYDKEVNMKIEVTHSHKNSLNIIIKTDRPYFQNYIDGELLFHTPTDLYITFKPRNKFEILLWIFPEEFEYLKSFNSVSFEYPDYLVESSARHYSRLDVSQLLVEKARYERNEEVKRREREKPVNRIKSFFGLGD